MLNFEFDDEATLKAISALHERARNYRPALNEAAAYMERQTKLRFAREEAPDGTPWAPLAESTVRRKLRGYTYRKRRRVKIPGKYLSTILRETGVLASGIAARPASDTQASVETTAGAEYGIWHQLGTKRMPARPYLGFSSEDVTVVQQIFKRHLDGKL